MKQLNQYPSYDGRILVTETDLSSYVKDGVLYANDIPSAEKRNITDCPNTEAVNMVLEARSIIASLLQPQQLTKLKLRNKVYAVAQEAADEHDRCLQKKPAVADHLHYCHIYPLQDGRYIVSTRSLRYAYTNGPAYIILSSIAPEHWPETMILSNIRVARLICNSISGTWTEPKKLLSKTVPHPSRFHNTCFHSGFNTYILDGDDHFALNNISMIKEETVIKTLLYDLTYQLAVSQFMRTVAKKVA